VTWIDHQHRSKKLAAAAQSSLRRGDDASARRLFAQAAQEAGQALAQVSPEKRVTLGRSPCQRRHCGDGRIDRMMPPASHASFVVRPSCFR
jgi:hypothetical protein